MKRPPSSGRKVSGQVRDRLVLRPVVVSNRIGEPKNVLPSLPPLARYSQRWSVPMTFIAIRKPDDSRCSIRLVVLLIYTSVRSKTSDLLCQNRRYLWLSLGSSSCPL